MLSNEIAATRRTLSELGGQVDQKQWGVIRSCIQRLGGVESKIRGVEGIINPDSQHEGAQQNG